jgi:hypothetical protein
MTRGDTIHDDQVVLGDRVLGDQILGDRVFGESKTDWRQSCGAMAQQQGDTTARSTPQKFVHLVGYRDPSTKPVRR